MKHTLLSLCALLFITMTSFAQSGQNRIKTYNLNKGLAIEGYDPVSYFNGKPLKGATALAFTHEGVTYHFANAANLNSFKQNPRGYEPQYGGWCAYAMGNTGEKVEVDPETFKIINGKLFLFYNHLFTNTLKSWNKNEGPLKAKADVNWQKFAGK